MRIHSGTPALSASRRHVTIIHLTLLSAIVPLAGCGGGAGSGLGIPPTGGTGGTGGSGSGVSIARGEGTARFHVDVQTGRVTIAPLQGTRHAGRAVFAGTTIAFKSSTLLDQPGDVGRKVLSVSLLNHSSETIGQMPGGAATGVRVIVGPITNLTNFTSDLRSQTQVRTYAGTGSLGSSDGAVLSATFGADTGIASDASGNLYVVDSTNRVRKISGGFVSTLAGNGTASSVDGPGTTATFNTPFGIAYNPADDTLVVADYAGNRIRRVTKDGSVTTIGGTGSNASQDGPGNSASFFRPTGLAVSSEGTIFVAEYGGNRIRKITLTGADPRQASSYTVTTLAGSGAAATTDGIGTGASFNHPVSIANDPSGALYVAEGSGNRIRRVSTAGEVATIAGTGTAGSADGSGATATFNSPHGLAFVAPDTLLACDGASQKIRQLRLPAGGAPTDPSAWQVGTIAGTGSTGPTDGAGNFAQFNFPFGISVDPSGRVFVADTSNHKVRQIVPSGGLFPVGAAGGVSGGEPIQMENVDGLIPSTGASPNLPYMSYDGSLAAGASSSARDWAFLVPKGVTAFEFTATVEANTTTGAPPESVDNGPTPTAPNNVGSPNVQVRTLAGNGTVSGFQDGPASSALFGFATFVAVDRAGDVFVSEEANNAIRRIGTDGRVSTIAGAIGAGGGFADGPGTAAQFRAPWEIATNEAGTEIFVADTINQRIRRIALTNPLADPTNPANWTVSTVAGTGAQGGTYTTARGDVATFEGPNGLALDVGGNIYVGEEFGQRIREIQYRGGDRSQASNWQVTLLAGDVSATVGLTGTTDGTGANARFNFPQSLACDRAGNVYVGDASNHRVRRIAPGGVVTTLAGGLSGDVPVAGYADGPAVSGGLPVARFHNVHGLAVDSAGYVYVADYDNSRVRRISPAGIVTTVAGTGVTGGSDGSGATATVQAISLAIDLSGNLYAGQIGPSSIRVIQRVIASP